RTARWPTILLAMFVLLAAVQTRRVGTRKNEVKRLTDELILSSNRTSEVVAERDKAIESLKTRQKPDPSSDSSYSDRLKTHLLEEQQQTERIRGELGTTQIALRECKSEAAL